MCERSSSNSELNPLVQADERFCRDLFYYALCERDHTEWYLFEGFCLRGARHHFRVIFQDLSLTMKDGSPRKMRRRTGGF